MAMCAPSVGGGAHIIFPTIDLYDKVKDGCSGARVTP